MYKQISVHDMLKWEVKLIFSEKLKWFFVNFSDFRQERKRWTSIVRNLLLLRPFS